MPILSGAGWRKFLTMDTSIPQVTNLLRAQAENNVLDCAENPALDRELVTRCRAALEGARDGVNGGLGALPGAKDRGRPVAPFEYREEPTDEWRTFGMLAEMFPLQAMILDCDCVSPIWAAFFWRRWAGRVGVGVGISQPKTRPCRCRAEGAACKGVRCTPAGPVCETCGYGMAHAYTVLRLDDLPALARRTLAPLLVPMTGVYNGAAVFDGSVHAGMGRPKDDFYGSGETSLKWLRREDTERAA